MRRNRNAFALAGVMLAATLGGVGALLVTPTRAQAQEISTGSVRTGETESGNLLADAVRAAGNAEIGLIPAAAFRPNARINRPASAADAAGLVDPAGDTVSVLTLTGSQILSALERSVSFAPQSSAGFLQVSGIKFTFGTGSQKRVQNVTVGGQPLEASRKYKVAVTKPLANGQQGYHQIWDRDSISSDTGKSLATALDELAKARGGSLSPTLEGRITRSGD